MNTGNLGDLRTQKAHLRGFPTWDVVRRSNTGRGREYERNTSKMRILHSGANAHSFPNGTPKWGVIIGHTAPSTEYRNSVMILLCFSGGMGM